MRKSPRVSSSPSTFNGNCPFGIALELGYVGSKSTQPRSERASLNINALNPQSARHRRAYQCLGGESVLRQGRHGRYRHPRSGQSQLLLPYPDLWRDQSVLRQLQPCALRLDDRQGAEALQPGPDVPVTFTWSRNRDASAGGAGNTLNGGNKGPQNPYNTAAEYGSSNINTPWSWATAVTYELPVGQGQNVPGQHEQAY